MPAARRLLLSLVLLSATSSGDAGIAAAASARSAPTAKATRTRPATRPTRTARRAAASLPRRSVLPRLRIDYSLARFRPESYLSGSTIGVSGPIDPDNPRVEARIFASADSQWRYQIRFRGADFDVPPRRLSRARRLELESALRAEVVRTPVVAEPLAYLIADLGIKQPPLAQPVDFTGLTLVSAASLSGDGGSIRGFRFRGFAGDRLLEVDMSFDGTGNDPVVQVRRWKPSDGYSSKPSRGRSRPLAAGELETLERVLSRRARETRDAFDPSGIAAGIIQRQRESREAGH